MKTLFAWNRYHLLDAAARRLPAPAAGTGISRQILLEGAVAVSTDEYKWEILVPVSILAVRKNL